MYARLDVRHATSSALIRPMPQTRRFPPPWSAEVTPNCFIVRDADGQQLAYVYYESEPGRADPVKWKSPSGIEPAGAYKANSAVRLVSPPVELIDQRSGDRLHERSHVFGEAGHIRTV
jgi:hypothetical protein